ncbi:cytochrome P450 4C1-like isoform X2 [Sitophilus oryzae]|uniref:Cytochrome P450 4C1-like isoform X2 n=1 Tax=Sitophilus oryzae TaxID=7048 RepID=A0A6J2YDT6_SITOR|nr:cytochrome P450 4C1-like isoform X2 [Sitophilus oryzae]
MVFVQVILAVGIVLIVMIVLSTIWSLHSKRPIFKFAQKYQVFDKFHPIFGNLLELKDFTIQWKPKRKLMSKNFRPITLNSFTPVFYKNSKLLVEEFGDMKNEDIFDVCIGYTLRAFIETMGHKNHHFQPGETSKIAKCIDLGQRIAGDNIVKYTSGYLLFFWIWTDIMDLIKLIKSVMAFKTLLRQIFGEREKEIRENSPTSNILLDSLIQADRKVYTKYAAYTDFVTFAFAAVDTSGNTLAFLLTLLGMHPDIQDKVYKEILEEIGLDRAIEVQDLPKLKYVERVIFETLRLFPIAPVIGRYTTKDVICGTQTIPKGVNIMISILDVHRNERYWTDPLKFDPDRFLPEEIAKRPSSYYIPFSTGPRNCIGKTYALLSLKVVVATVVRHYRMSSNYKSVEEMDLRSLFTMRTTHNLDCQLTPR